MALIQCSECGKSISSKAASCPGCGCPVEVSVSNERSLQEVDCSKLSKEELWQKAYDIQYKGSKVELPAAKDIYGYIIANYSNSDEAKFDAFVKNVMPLAA